MTVNRRRISCKFNYVCVIVAIAIASTGCASRGVEQAGTGTGDNISWKPIAASSTSEDVIRFFGFIDVTQDIEGESQYFEAGFAQFDNPAPLRVVIDSFRQPELDTCDYHERVEGDNRPLEFPDEMALPGYPYKFISVGNEIDVTHGNRRYAKMTRTSKSPDDQVQYETDVGSLPISIGGLKLGDVLLKMNGLRVHAPGEEFPSFENINIPAIDRTSRFKLSSKDKVEAGTRFRWRKGKYADDEGVRFQIEAGGGGRALFCAAFDDGEFRLPQSIQSLLGDEIIRSPSAYRDVLQFYRNSDALLIVSQSSYY